MPLIDCKNNFDLNWSETCVTLVTAINADLTEKSGTLKIKKILNFFEIIYKNGKNNYKN